MEVRRTLVAVRAICLEHDRAPSQRRERPGGDGEHVTDAGNVVAEHVTGDDPASKGNDVVVGGAGKDKLKGGKGADAFVFEFASDSGGSPKGSDLIQDFKRGQGDRIDLSAIDPHNSAGTFAFIGKKKFSGEAGELRWQKKGSKTVASGDIDGDGAPDIAIMVAKAGAMKAADFIL